MLGFIFTETFNPAKDQEISSPFTDEETIGLAKKFLFVSCYGKT